MREIVAADQPFVRDEVDRATGEQVFADQPYKLDIIEKVDASEVGEGSVVSLYRNPRVDGDAFVDLCLGPHVRRRSGSARSSSRGSPARTGGRRERSAAPAHLRHGVGVRRALDEHLHRLAEAERRDHRRLGEELDLFSFPDEIGSGLAVFHPKGGVVRKRDGGLLAAAPRGGGLPLRELAAHHEGRAVRDLGPPRVVAEGMFPPMELDEDGGHGRTTSSR